MSYRLRELKEFEDYILAMLNSFKKHNPQELNWYMPFDSYYNRNDFAYHYPHLS